MSRRLKLLPVLAAAAVTFTASAALAEVNPSPPQNCFKANEWLGWKSLAPNVLLVRVSPNRVWRLDLQEGSDQLKYTDVRIINQHMTSNWLCAPGDFQLRLTDRFGIVDEPLIVTSVRQLSPEEIDAIPPRDRP